MGHPGDQCCGATADQGYHRQRFHLHGHVRGGQGATRPQWFTEKQLQLEKGLYIHIYIYIHIHINPQGFFSTTAGYRPFLSRQVWFRIALRSRDIKTSGAPDMPLPRALLHPLPWNRLQGGPWMQQILLSFGENLLLRGAYSEDVMLHS